MNNAKKNLDVQGIIKNSTLKVIPGRFAIVKTSGFDNSIKVFLVSLDDTETTMIVEERQLSKINYIDVQKWFRLIRMEVSVPFFSVGFLATVTSAIAKKGINVLVESTFSYDYLLIRENDFQEAYKALQDLGFRGQI